mmetsp:Transcript_30699/g.102145  ORF Transcript_30699/g.102145 Transcript_30699/m.102145 type:complete len:328 (-) Transcript_30699:1723-2706(-)
MSMSRLALPSSHWKEAPRCRSCAARMCSNWPRSPSSRAHACARDKTSTRTPTSRWSFAVARRAGSSRWTRTATCSSASTARHSLSGSSPPSSAFWRACPRSPRWPACRPPRRQPSRPGTKWSFGAMLLQTPPGRRCGGGSGAQCRRSIARTALHTSLWQAAQTCTSYPAQRSQSLRRCHSLRAPGSARSKTSTRMPSSRSSSTADRRARCFRSMRRVACSSASTAPRSRSGSAPPSSSCWSRRPSAALLRAGTTCHRHQGGVAFRRGRCHHCKSTLMHPTLLPKAALQRPRLPMLLRTKVPQQTKVAQHVMSQALPKSKLEHRRTCE